MGAEAYRWTCACCGERFTGLPMALAFEAPLGWEGLDDATRDASFIDTDFCEIRHAGGRIDRFIRALLPFPVPGLGEEFHFNVWSSVSEKSWAVYEDGFRSGVYGEQGCFGYLSNEIPGFPARASLHANVWFQDDRMRPLMELHETDHPLYFAQRDGIDVGQVERWVALSHRQ